MGFLVEEDGIKGQRENPSQGVNGSNCQTTGGIDDVQSIVNRRSPPSLGHWNKLERNCTFHR